MKKTIIYMLAICLVMQTVSVSATASADNGADGAAGISVGGAVGEGSAVEMAQALGIINGDEKGNLNLSNQVSRAEFVKMAVAASKFKDSTGSGQGVSLYSDVGSGHWASRYIMTAVEQGWVTGYTDGSFRPQNGIKLEEAVSVALSMLGYGWDDFQGAFPWAQLDKYTALGLDAGISAGQGVFMTRRDCAVLFYNMMVTRDKTGEYYGTGLGYEIKDGKISYTALITANTKGAFVMEDSSVPASINGYSVYRNNTKVSIGDLKKYDVYYYNPGMKVIWAYDSKVTGTLSKVSPNMAAPEKITIAGNEYDIEGSSVAFDVSTSGSRRIGDVVTVLLGMNGGAVKIIEAANIFAEYYGVVVSSVKESTVVSGAATLKYRITVACTDGVERDFYADRASSVGSAVSVKYKDGVNEVSSLSNNRIGGSFTQTSFAGKTLADDVRIIDTNGDGGWARVYPSRLAGNSMGERNVIAIVTNGEGKITDMILKNATGDVDKYGIITKSIVHESEDEELGTERSGEYSWIIDGEAGSMTTTGKVFSVSTGGARFVYSKGEVSNIRNLKQVSVTSMNQFEASSGNKKIKFAENLQVYIAQGGKYYKSDLVSVMNNPKYSCLAWTDDSSSPAGGRIRVLIAR